MATNIERPRAVVADNAGGVMIGESAAADRPDPAWGVFETIAVKDGRVQALEPHLERLAGAVGELYGQALPEDLARRVRAQARPLRGRHRLRVQAKREPGGVEILISSESYAAPDPQRVTMLTPAVVPGGLGPHKWSDRRLIDSLSTEQSVPLLLDIDGHVLEAAWANVWIVEGRHVVTPPADGRLLAGITRASVLELAGDLGLAASAEPISLVRLRQADAIFLTSSLRLVASAGLEGHTSRPAGIATVSAIRTELQNARWDPPPAPE
jgi:para-aminobenzoate synthetase / 4-amino-4-deoxychorismate lyase